MKITIESTTKVIQLIMPGGVAVPARVWQGETKSGIPVQVYITRIVPEISVSDPRIDELTAEFERELQRQETPREAVAGIPLRLII